MDRIRTSWLIHGQAVVPYDGPVAGDRSRKARSAGKRRRRVGRVENDLTDAQWATLKAAWGGCAYCGATDAHLQRDCVQAISRGGRYTLENVVPACGSCNASKANDEVTSWLRRKRLDERAFLLRHLEILPTLTTPVVHEADPGPHAEPATSAAPERRIR